MQFLVENFSAKLPLKRNSDIAINSVSKLYFLFNYLYVFRIKCLNIMTKIKNSWILIFVFTGLIFSCEGDSTEPEFEEDVPIGEFIDQNTYSVFPQPSQNFDVAQFRLWLPESESKVRAIAVLLPGHNSNGLGLSKSPQWQDFARKEKLALLAVHFNSGSDNTGYYSQSEEGSGLALLTALEKFSEESGQEYLKDLPFLLRGFSAGGLFSHSFSAFLHERVLAFGNIRGGGLDLTPDINKGIPGIMFYGENDFQYRNERIIEVVELKRSIGGNWCLVKEPVVDHFGRLNRTDSLLQKLFSKVLAKRLAPGSNELLPLEEKEGWLGNHGSFEIGSYKNYSGNKSKASWLIDEEFARSWQKFQMESD